MRCMWNCGGVISSRQGITKIPFNVYWLREEPGIESKGVAFADAVESESE